MGGALSKQRDSVIARRSVLGFSTTICFNIIQASAGANTDRWLLVLIRQLTAELLFIIPEAS